LSDADARTLLPVTRTAAVVFAPFVFLDIDFFTFQMVQNFRDDFHVLNRWCSDANSVVAAEEQHAFELYVVPDAHVSEVDIQLVTLAHAVLARSVFENGVHLVLLLGTWFVRHQRGDIMRVGHPIFQTFVRNLVARRL
jgi:hypothetical protein